MNHFLNKKYVYNVRSWVRKGSWLSEMTITSLDNSVYNLEINECANTALKELRKFTSCGIIFWVQDGILRN